MVQIRICICKKGPFLSETFDQILDKKMDNDPCDYSYFLSSNWIRVGDHLYDH